VLLAQLRAGSQDAFSALYVERYPELLRAAVRAVGSRALGDEVVQDVFLSMWVRRAELVVRTTVRAYLHGAVRLRAVTCVRQDIERRDIEHADIVDFPELTSAAESADERVVSQETQRRLLAAIRALPERQREALILWSRHRMGLVELGDALGVSHVAARKLLRKAQDRLHAILAETERAP
jgi:RNA polymerase sigma-70 factor (ECF subfamily)